MEEGKLNRFKERHSFYSGAVQRAEPLPTRTRMDSYITVHIFILYIPHVIEYTLCTHTYSPLHPLMLFSENIQNFPFSVPLFIRMRYFIQLYRNRIKDFSGEAGKSLICALKCGCA